MKFKEAEEYASQTRNFKRAGIYLLKNFIGTFQKLMEKLTTQVQ